MIRHIALFTFTDETTVDQIEALTTALGEMPGRIDTIRSYHCGPDLDATKGSWDFAVVGDFDDLDGYHAYARHPDHVRVVEDHVRPIMRTMARVQVELD